MDEKEEVKTEVVIEKSSTKATIIQIMFLILLLCAIAGLLMTTITILKYKDMLKNPVGYNMEKFGLTYCTCYNDDNNIIPITATNLNKTVDELIPKPVTCPSSNYQQINLTNVLN
jgi:hypothetical protein